MKNLENLKMDIKKNTEIKNCFANVKDEKEAAKIAKKLGYEVSETELKNDEELNEDMLEAVAGGKGDSTTVTKEDTIVVTEPGKFKEVVRNRETGKITAIKK